MKTHSIGVWKTTFSEKEEVFSGQALLSATLMVREWISAFVKERTWAMNHFGVPSLVIRLDCFLDEKGHMHGIEIEDRPMGIGITSIVNSQFASELDRFRSESWPKIGLLSSNKRKGGDDHIWLSPPQSEDDLLLVRCSPEEKDFYCLRNRSISTISTEGDKSYGEKLDLWNRISYGDRIPWDEPFVLKPIQGTRCDDIVVWLPKDMMLHGISVKKREVNGNSTKTKVERTLSSNGTMYLQRFVPPMVCSHLVTPSGKPYFMLYRLFFFFDIKTERYVPVGGIWTARPFQLLLHGSSDAVMGPLKIED